MNINYFVTSSSVTLFWDKPYDADENTLYEIFLDGKKYGETPKTHYTVKELSPEQTLKVEVKSTVGCGALEVTVAKARRKID